MRYANLSPAECRRRLDKLGLSLRRPGRATPGVANPRRIVGKLGGVSIRAPGGSSPYGVLDCRLLLTLVELAPLLKEHGVTGVRIDNMYRPHAHLPGRRTRSQHAYGLAADIMSFRLDDGRELVVERDWHGSIGDKACGKEATLAELDDKSVRLRNLVCAIARAELFHHMLTPGADAAHKNHFHFDIKRGAKRTIIR